MKDITVSNKIKTKELVCSALEKNMGSVLDETR